MPKQVLFSDEGRAALPLDDEVEPHLGEVHEDLARQDRRDDPRRREEDASARRGDEGVEPRVRSRDLGEAEVVPSGHLDERVARGDPLDRHLAEDLAAKRQGAGEAEREPEQRDRRESHAR